MPHIDVKNDAPGIRSLFAYRPETAHPLSHLAEALLRGPSPLDRGERELIAAYVSSLNDCYYCCSSHSAYAAAQLQGGMPLVQQVRADLETAPVSDKLRALLRIAGAVQRSGQEVTETHIEAARSEGATDLEIHDTVLIAAAFCMYNRYVDGLATVAPTDPTTYTDRAPHIVNNGYLASLPPLP